jgi:hypothetical protein
VANGRAAPAWHIGLSRTTTAPFAAMLTLRQIEVIRAILATGTVGGAAGS